MVLNFYKWLKPKGKFWALVGKNKKKEWSRLIQLENSLCKIPAARSLSNYQKRPETQSHRLLSRKSTERTSRTARNQRLPSPGASGDTWFLPPLWTQALNSSCLSFLLWAHESETISKALFWVSSSVTLHDPFSKFYIFLFSFFLFWSSEKIIHTLSIWCPSWRLAKSPAPQGLCHAYAWPRRLSRHPLRHHSLSAQCVQPSTPPCLSSNLHHTIRPLN